MRKLMFAMILFLIIVYTNSITPSIASQDFNSPIETRILSIQFGTIKMRADYTEFQFQVSGEVWNKYDMDILIAHPNTCGFTLYLGDLNSSINESIYSGAVCGQAITNIYYQPGVQNYSLTESIIVEKGNLSVFPDTEFIMSIGGVGKTYRDMVKPNLANVTVNNGNITIQSNGITSDWGEVYSTPTNFVNPYDQPADIPIDTGLQNNFTDKETSELLPVNVGFMILPLGMIIYLTRKIQHK